MYEALDELLPLTPQLAALQMLTAYWHGQMAPAGEARA